MANNSSSVLSTLNKTLSFLFIFLFPLFFLPFTSNFYETNKLALAIGYAAILLIVWAVLIVVKKAFTFTITPFTLPLLGIILTTLVSVFLSGNHPVNALVGKGSLIPALALGSLVLAGLIKSRRFVHLSLYTLIGSSVILSLVSIFQSLGFGLSKVVNTLFHTAIADTLAFTPAGSPLAILTFIAPVVVITLFLAFTRKESLEKIVLFLVSAIMASAIVLVLVYSFPGKDTSPVFLPWQDGYSIALETLKNPKRALIGFGPESFTTAYNQLRPATMNLSRYWNIRFNNSSNELFEIVTTTGILGLIAWIALAVAVIRTAKNTGSSTEAKVIKIAVLAMLLLMILLPATYLHLFLLFILLALWSIQLRTDHEYVKEITAPLGGISLVRPGERGQQERELVILPYIAAIPLVVIAGVTLYFAYKAYAAELSFKQAVDFAAKNQAVETYNAQRAAIQQNPFLPRYRRAYSATNLAIANALASKKDLTDQDRQQIAQLIQQSIREAKAAVTLEPTNTVNWENLTFIYKSLINVAQNADQWTVAALAQAIKNDPINPRLRLELGGVYYSLGQFDQSIRFYQQAAELKPDWANAFYNLAAAHKQKKENAQAYDYLRQVIALVKPDSADYTKAQKELQDLATTLNLKKTDQTPTGPAQGDLNVPSPAPTRTTQEQINIPANAAPENTQGGVETIPTPIPPQATPTPPTSP